MKTGRKKITECMHWLTITSTLKIVQKQNLLHYWYQGTDSLYHAVYCQLLIPLIHLATVKYKAATPNNCTWVCPAFFTLKNNSVSNFEDSIYIVHTHTHTYIYTLSCKLHHCDSSLHQFIQKLQHFSIHLV